MSETIGILMELLNEYRESGCAIEEDRVTYYADRLDGRTEDERMEERTKTEHNGVGITDELRRYAAHAVERSDYMAGLTYDLDRIADRIDERHAVKVERLEKYRAAVDAMLKEYVKLPVDADGVPIHIGDVMEWSNGSFTVHELKLTEDGWQTWDSEHGYTVHADECIHHQPDTWERIIEDALTVGWPNDSWSEVASAEVHDSLVERCKKLAGDAE